MTLASRIDEFGKPAWIALTVVSFIAWWPLGLLALGFLIGSKRMGCGWRDNGARWQRKMQRWQRGMDRMQSHAERWWGPSGGAASSGNRAFDEYRAETLRRLEDEQREFIAFLDRLRQAKDKAEFDQFMAERTRRPDPPPPVN